MIKKALQFYTIGGLLALVFAQSGYSLNNLME